MATSNQPPAYAIHEVKLDTETESKIVHVNVYSNRAEISRRYKLGIKSGQNQVVITGLPNVLDTNSIRVEGRGIATIQDVTVSRDTLVPPPKSSPKLQELFEQKEDTTKALERCKASLAGLERYLASMKAEHVKVSDLLPIMENYNEAAEKYGKLESKLQRELKQLDTSISEERAALAASVAVNSNLLMKATIGVFAESATVIQLVLLYGVTGASWSAKYDIRASTTSKESPVELIYKASITQNTGEDWTDVPLTLETAALTFGLSIPTLSTWNLSIYKPAPPPKPVKTHVFMRKSTARMTTVRDDEEDEESDEDMGFGLFDDAPAAAPTAVAQAAVTSKGDVSATFSIPGLITIPSDGTAHNVTIVKLTPEAKLIWIAVPAVDTKVHLTTKVKNTSDYTLLSGESSVYVDGSFISKSSLPLVSPLESFTCALGLDPSIRIAYPPRIKKASQSGLINKTSSTSFSQRIMVHNSKNSNIDHLRITDRISVSQDALISVKLVSPELTLPFKLPVGSLKDAKAPPPVKVEDGIVAQWRGADEGVTAEYLGKDGKIDWICALAPQRMVELSLQWEVSMPSQATVLGL